MLEGRTHRWFARWWDRQTGAENDAIRAMRREVAGGALGRVLEVGCGPGSNLPYYGAGATRLVGLDPNPHMLRIAAQKAASRPMDLVRARAEALPFRNGAFDTVVSTANFCSIERPKAALSEIRRALRPGGEYRFYDHVRSEDSGLLAWVQDVITPIHRRLLGTGCRLNRRIGEMVQGAGFTSSEIEHRKPVPWFPMGIYRPHVIGVARR